jgi:hypothetical protein
MIQVENDITIGKFFSSAVNILSSFSVELPLTLTTGFQFSKSAMARISLHLTFSEHIYTINMYPPHHTRVPAEASIALSPDHLRTRQWNYTPKVILKLQRLPSH